MQNCSVADCRAQSARLLSASRFLLSASETKKGASRSCIISQPLSMISFCLKCFRLFGAHYDRVSQRLEKCLKDSKSQCPAQEALGERQVTPARTQKYKAVCTLYMYLKLGIIINYCIHEVRDTSITLTLFVHFLHFCILDVAFCICVISLTSQSYLRSYCHLRTIVS